MDGFPYAIPDDTWELNFAVLHPKRPGRRRPRVGQQQLPQLARVRQRLREHRPALCRHHRSRPRTPPCPARSRPRWRATASLLTGHLLWTNQLNGASGQFAYAPTGSFRPCRSPGGVNVIRVSGTNSHVNPNHGAWDSPTNAAYAAAWPTAPTAAPCSSPGQSTAAAPAMASTNTDAALSLGPRAWALQASGGAVAEAIRPFAGSLHPGDVVSFVFENGWVDTGNPSSIGVAFQNRFGQNLLQFFSKAAPKPTRSSITIPATPKSTGATAPMSAPWNC
jgi:hypothetical protein